VRRAPAFHEDNVSRMTSDEMLARVARETIPKLR